MNTLSNSSPVTVLLSVYNGEKTLERCIRSICAQTYQNLSLVCIDDCSTDHTQEILKKIQEQFPNIPFTLIRNEKNVGLTHSLNRGLETIDSFYTARIDADDWWEPTKIEKQMAFLESHPDYGVIGTNYINHSAETSRSVVLPKTDAEIHATIFWRNPFAHSAVMYRTDFIRSLGGYNPNVPYAQDYELWVRCFPHTKFYNIQEFLCHRTLGTSISVKRQNEQMRLYLRVLLTYLPKYRRPLTEYGALIEPTLVLLTPNWIKNLKRKYFP